MSTPAKWVWNWDYNHPDGYPRFWSARWAEREVFSKENLKKVPTHLRRRKWIPTQVVFATDLCTEGTQDFYEVPLSEFHQLDSRTLRYMQKRQGI